jgi:hypothetical protein
MAPPKDSQLSVLETYKCYHTGEKSADVIKGLEIGSLSWIM